MPSRSANDIKIDARITYDAADGLAGRVHAEADATINAAKRVQDAARRAYAAAEGGHLEEAETGLTEAKIDLVKAAAGAAAGDPKDEWKECRTSIDRFDRLLVELRKTGFGFVTAIVSASAFLLGPTTPVSTSSTPLIKVGVFFIITLLIVTLFAIDRAHQVWLAAAVQRAKFLEESTLQYWITRNISDKFTQNDAWVIGIALYVLLLVITAVIFVFSLETLQANRWVWNQYQYWVGVGFGVGLFFLVLGAYAGTAPSGARSFIVAVIAVIIIAVVSALLLQIFQEPADVAFSTGAVRL